MAGANYTGLIPENTEGRAITAEASASFDSNEAARSFYEKAKRRLFEVNNWHHITGALGAGFQLTDNEGKETNRRAQKGDHFRVDITGPGSRAGEGYDWALVEDVREVHLDHVDSAAILVRPAKNPQTSNEAVAHFFSPKSTSTFVVTREGNTVVASVHDRNIEANEETTEPLDKARNAAVGLAAKHGFSKLQWQALADAFVSKD